MYLEFQEALYTAKAVDGELGVECVFGGTEELAAIRSGLNT